jgi:isopenicillin N synthase-like dioxygenase
MLATTLDLPVINIDEYLKDPTSKESLAECAKLEQAIKQYSAFAIRDGRVTEEENSTFLDLMEDYFDQPNELKMADTRPELHYQVGATPANTELPRCGRDDDCIEMVNLMKPANKPFEFDKPDPKWRFFWRLGEPPVDTKFKQLNADPVVPEGFSNWKDEMNHWGGKMQNSVSVVAEMLAIGLGLKSDTFTKLAENGPHLLAPTGTDLKEYGNLHTVLAGFHTDLNFLTIHGKSRFSGLHIWTPNGDKMLVKIPNGCLLVQAGKQLEHLTGGYITAGYHEVVVVNATLDQINQQKSRGRPLWRISSTVFYHLASDNILQPVEKFKCQPNAKLYPAQYVGDQVQKELGFLELAN